MKNFLLLTMALLCGTFLVPSKVHADPVEVFGASQILSVDVATADVLPSFEVLTEFEFAGLPQVLAVPVTVIAKSGLTLPFGLNWVSIISLLVGIYEVIVRAIPSVGNNSAIHKVFEFLKWISDFLNVKKK